MRFIHMILMLLACWCSTAVADTYVTCGNKKSPYRLVVLTESGYTTVQIFKRGEKYPSTNATAALSFPRCGQKRSCSQSPTGIKTIDHTPSYHLALPWRAMESQDSFHAVLNEQTKGHLGEPVTRKFNLTCKPGENHQALIASYPTTK
ncbi:MAG: hypothetical protein AB7N80_09615 [Bdellovibrionales bacterium]